MFLRFVAAMQAPDSHRRTGALVAAHELRDSGELPDGEQARLESMLLWFNTHLRRPTHLSYETDWRAVFWFKAGAAKLIGRMWDLVELMRTNGRPVVLIKTDEPGTIVYEDKWQVAAKPLRGKRTS